MPIATSYRRCTYRAQRDPTNLGLGVHRLGEIRDSSYENQRYRASSLELVAAAITLWNTVYLERAAAALRRQHSDR
jgi:TnpA family transposase